MHKSKVRCRILNKETGGKAENCDRNGIFTFQKVLFVYFSRFSRLAIITRRSKPWTRIGGDFFMAREASMGSTRGISLGCNKNGSFEGI